MPLVPELRIQSHWECKQEQPTYPRESVHVCRCVCRCVCPIFWQGSSNYSLIYFKDAESHDKINNIRRVNREEGRASDNVPSLTGHPSLLFPAFGCPGWRWALSPGAAWPCLSQRHLIWKGLHKDQLCHLCWCPGNPPSVKAAVSCGHFTGKTASGKAEMGAPKAAAEGRSAWYWRVKMQDCSLWRVKTEVKKRPWSQVSQWEEMALPS